MNDDKMKEMEKLRKQIDPEILAKVAKSYGVSVPGTSSGAAPARASSKPSPAINNWATEQMKKQVAKKYEPKLAGFVVFDNSPFEAKKINAYLLKMGIKTIFIATDAATLVQGIINFLNEKKVQNTCICVNQSELARLYTILNSPDLENVRNMVPELLKLPTFIMVNGINSRAFPEDFDMRFVLDYNEDPFNNMKKVSDGLNSE